MTSLLVLLSGLQGQTASITNSTLLASPLLAAVSHLETGELSAKVVIVDELKQVPVAFTDFSVIGPDPGTIRAVRTDGNGEIDVKLEPGLYAFESRDPIDFKGQKYTWSTSFEISANERTKLTLTHTDAIIEKPKVEPKPKVDKSTAETKLYQRYRSSVVTVECDSGSGSGFVIDADRGLIMTTYHVAGGSSFLSVRFSRQNHYEARFVAADPSADVAIIRVNPEVLNYIPAVPLVQGRHVGVEGQRIVAMGSPVFQQTTITQGIISKVEDDALLSDVKLSRGNSGGPILNLEGEAIGVATYGDAAKPGDAGVSGIVSIRKADHLLSTIQNLTAATLPPADKLPDNSPVTIPADMLERISQSIKGGEPFLKSPKNFRTYIKTPFDANLNAVRYKNFLKQKIARRYGGKVPADQDLEMGPLYFWNKYVGNQFEPVVSIEVIPWPQETNGSFLTRVAAFALGTHSKTQKEMRDDFTKMVLYRNGVEVTPILRKRIRDTEIYDTQDMVMRDTALSGFYTYQPQVFTPGSKLELHVWKNADKKPTVIRIPSSYQDRIWNQFRDWSRLGG
ncbi:MAG: trypsin-like peptidase domain-containing protein [Armatimonadetes bacterium]|nr:trypsin-like peptidase domain-containing protein [Armatimonadota bacterium]